MIRLTTHTNCRGTQPVKRNSRTSGVFSFLLLFTFVVVTFVLACLICALMYTSHRFDHMNGGESRTSPHHEGKGRIFGSVSTAVEVTLSIQEWLGKHIIESATNSDMCKVLKEGRVRIRSEKAAEQVDEE